jgi:hypothetical protein
MPPRAFVVFGRMSRDVFLLIVIIYIYRISLASRKTLFALTALLKSFSLDIALSICDYCPVFKNAVVAQW